MKSTGILASISKLQLGPPARAYARLSRGLLSIEGPESSKFLNGIVTNKIDGSSREYEGTYAAFLNAKGRVMADVFLHRNLVGSGRLSSQESEEPASYLIECDSVITNRLYSLLKAYKLRSKVKITKLDPESYNVFSIWDDTEETSKTFFPLSAVNPLLVKHEAEGLISGASDNRAPGFGVRLICSSSVGSPHAALHDSFLDMGDLVETDALNYKLRRILYGIPEGSAELIPEKSLPLDSCMDYMGGVDFDKGCYLGQELTIRSHHHGIVRKRIIPVVLGESDELVLDPSTSIKGEELVGKHIYQSESDSETETKSKSSVTPESSSSPFASRGASLRAKKKPSGGLISSIGNVGLALVKLEHFAKPDAQFYLEDCDVPIKGFVPYWWP